MNTNADLSGTDRMMAEARAALLPNVLEVCRDLLAFHGVEPRDLDAVRAKVTVHPRVGTRAGARRREARFDDLVACGQLTPQTRELYARLARSGYGVVDADARGVSLERVMRKRSGYPDVVEYGLCRDLIRAAGGDPPATWLAALMGGLVDEGKCYTPRRARAEFATWLPRVTGVEYALIAALFERGFAVVSFGPDGVDLARIVPRRRKRRPAPKPALAA